MMSFVDHEHRSQFFLAARDHITRELQQKFALVLSRRRQSQIAGDVLQEFKRREASVKYVGIFNVRALVQQLQQAPQKKSLAGPHFSCQDDESFVPPNSVIESSESFVVPARGKQERRVGSDLEGISL